MGVVHNLMQTKQRFGLSSAALAAAVIVINKFVRRDRYLVYYSNAEDMKRFEFDRSNDLTCREVALAEMLDAAKNPDYQIDRTFILDSFARGARVIGAFSEGKMVGYVFTSTNLEAGNAELDYRFPSDSAFMFRGYTHPDYRGKKVVQAMIVEAIRVLKINNYFTFVRNINFPMRKVLERNGYRKIGGFVFAGPKNQPRNRVLIDRTVALRGIQVQLNPERNVPMKRILAS